jgi:hypothetical protein
LHLTSTQEGLLANDIAALSVYCEALKMNEADKNKSDESDECIEEVCEFCGRSQCEWKELGHEVVKIT